MNTTVYYILMIVIMLFTLTSLAALLIWVERRVLALWQDRYGPNRAGPFGLLIVAADTLKLFFKEDWIPPFADKFIFVIAPAIVAATVLMSFVIVPFAPGILVSDLNIGLLFFLAMSSLGVYSIVLGGWASNNKFSLLAAIRGASQMISYELAMGLSLIAVLMISGSLRMSVIVGEQIANGWNVIYQPLGFLIFFICSLAECNRTPFDLPEAENELNFGYHQEYSSMKLGFYLFAEYINMFISSVVMATLFFGGYDIPFVNEAAWGNHWWVGLIGFAVLMAKAFFFIFLFMWIRWTIPRFRFDQLMNLGWKKLLPLALINMLLTAVVVLLLNK